MTSKRRRIATLLIISSLFLLTACGKSEKSTDSLRESQGYEKEVLYIGKPCEFEINDNETWISSDENIAIVDNNIVTGISEGIVTVKRIGENKKVLEKREYLVTTFNDGKQADICYEIGKEGFYNAEVDYQSTVDPEYLQLHINTIQDVITYYQESNFYYYSDDPIITSGDSNWAWVMPGESVLLAKRGGVAEIANAVAYLLQDDFEDWGFVFEFGSNNYLYNWFYEDGTYYYMDFSEMLCRIKDGIRHNEYKPTKVKTIASSKLVAEKRINKQDIAAVVMVSAKGHTAQPAIYYSYLTDSTAVYREHCEVKFEECVYNAMTILYQNEHFDFEISSVPTEEMPLSVPTYGYRKQKYLK